MEKNEKSLGRKISLIIILVIGLALIVYASIHLVTWYIDHKNTEANIVKIHEHAGTHEVDGDSGYGDQKFIDVNFSELKNINPDTVGWIQLSDTSINYPFVQTSDNDFYLTHSFDKSKNEAGWVFLDFRNKIDEFDKNTVLYAHGRLDNTMFGSLKNVLSDDWLNNKDSQILKVATEKSNSLWQVFSVYHVAAQSVYLNTYFPSDNDFQSFAEMLKTRSIHDFEVNVGAEDKIISLSTCYNNNGSERLVLHAKLVGIKDKIEQQNTEQQEPEQPAAE